MARLQKAAEAFKQLNQRKKGKKKNKKGPAGADWRNREGLDNPGARTGGHTLSWREVSSRQDPLGTQWVPRLTASLILSEGVLTLRARPPSEGEFIDCFQKTKLAINLLVSQPLPTLVVRVGQHTGSHAHAICHLLVLPTPLGKAAEAHPKP